MKLPKDQPFWTSVILHVVVLLALALATIIQAFKPKKKDHVFEMVSLPPEVPVAAQTTAPEVPPPPDLPEINEMPDIPDVPPPPAPKPAPSPTPKPTPKPAPVMSYEEFVKQQGKPQPRKQTQPSQAKPVAVPQISAPTIQVPQNVPRSEQLTQAQMTALQRYTAQLQPRINPVWQYPSNLAGMRLKLTAVFDILPGGQITNIRLRPSSGNGAFDQSVLDAFRRVGSFGPTPTGKKHTFSLDFSTQN